KPQFLMPIFGRLSMVTQCANSFSDSVVVSGNGSAFSNRSKILGGIKAEASYTADASRSLAEILSAMGLRCIFNESQVVALTDVFEGIHVRHLAIQVNWKDSARPGSYRVFHLR